LKLARDQKRDCARRSHPARGAWIETRLLCVRGNCRRVAPRAGCVD